MTEQTTQEEGTAVAQAGDKHAGAGERKRQVGTPFTSQTAREAREARTRKEREGAARAERDAELDKLTVRARLATTGAAELTTVALRQVWQQLLTQATQGSGHVQVNAARLVFALASAAVEDDGGEEPDGVVWEELTPAQRAAAMAALDRHIIEVSALEEVEEGAREGEAPS